MSGGKVKGYIKWDSVLYKEDKKVIYNAILNHASEKKVSCVSCVFLSKRCS